MGKHHGLGGVGDKVSCDEGIFHAPVTHGDTVANGNGREHNGRSAGHGHSHFDRLGYLVEIHVTGDYFVIRADHPDEGAVELFGGQTESVIKAAVGCVVGALYYFVFNHNVLRKKSNNQLLMSLSSSLQL